ncbi:MAG: F0F1 ATP synthase subunit B [Bacilli bacterium]|nr:F0F1 ATP synthase subunit B [Bacilli bacterium]
MFNLLAHVYADAVLNPEDVINKLIPNVWDFVIQLIAFIVLIFIVFHFAYKPVKKLLKERGDYIEKNIKDSEKSKVEAAQYAKESQENIAKSREEANRIVAESKKQATIEAESIKTQAKEEVIALKKSAEEEIALAKKKSEQDVQREIVGVAIAASEAVLGREVNKEDEERLLNDFVKEVKK